MKSDTPVLRRRQRRGGNAIEFALTLPVLITVLAGIIDYSWYFSQHSGVIAACRAGARAGAVAPIAANAPADAQTAANASLTAQGITGGTVVATPIVMGNGDAGIAVQATIPFTPLVDFPLLGTPSNLTYTASMRLEN